MASGSSVIVKDTIEIYNDVTISSSLCLFAAGNGREFDTNFENNFSCAIISGTDELAINSGFEIYPNPASEYLVIDSKFQNTDYTIYNANGLVVQASTYNGKINTSQLAKGLYFLRIEKSGRMLIEKFVKQ